MESQNQGGRIGAVGSRTDRQSVSVTSKNRTRYSKSFSSRMKTITDGLRQPHHYYINYIYHIRRYRHVTRVT
uniref:Uncharacterized protein n=1 Tax=Ralstonia syzygii R24 TaxID=907261 RepID=G3AB23_9RALS|nr:hypothetical protein RALSY_mp30021 [Ralstonia syzygii R24]